MPAKKQKPLAQIFRPTPRNLARLAHALRRGELVGVPSETVYGLAGDALNPRACREIFRAKGRPSADPLIVHVHSLAQLDLIAHASDAAIQLARAFWPGPLTLVLPKKAVVSDLVTAGRPSVAVRMPRHPVFLALLRASGLPLAAPSANPFGYISPTSAQHVRDGLGREIRFILDGGDAEIGLESTILDLRNPARPTLLRPGAIDAKAIERVLKRRVTLSAKSHRQSPSKGELAPGMLSKHYSPKTPIDLVLRLDLAGLEHAKSDEVFLFLVRPRNAPKLAPRAGSNVVWLSPTNDLRRVAQALFATLRRLDGEGWKKIHAELAPGPSALALAINDRLTRAAAKR